MELETAISEGNRPATVRNATRADEPAMLELLFRTFQRWPAFQIEVPAIEHLRWKMQSHPLAPQNQWVAEIDGRIVAMMLRIVRTVRVRGRDHLARDGVDAAVDPRYQGRGLYSAILDHSRESSQSAVFALRLGYSTNPRTHRRNTPRPSRYLGNPIQVLQKPYRARAIVARRRARYGGRLPAPLAVLRIELARAFHGLGHPPYWRSVKRGWSILTLPRFDDRIDAFFDEASRPFDFLVVRSRDYLNWRYFDPAAGRFTVRAAEQEGRLLGYLVFKISEGQGCVADLLALPGRTDVARSLIEDALRVFREADLEQATCWMISRHPYNGILQRYGFIVSGSDAGFSYRETNLDESELAFLADAGTRIHLTHGDTDWI